MKKLYTGNELAAHGALAAGMNFAAGHPGSPSTEILETIVKVSPPSVYCEWAANEKIAVETAAGAAQAGAFALVVSNQAGLNFAADSISSINYIGFCGALVFAVCDDPGCLSSQTEHDTRKFAQYARMIVFAPSSPEEVYEMIQTAFFISNKYNRPIILRLTTRISHCYTGYDFDYNCKKLLCSAESDNLLSLDKKDKKDKNLYKTTVVEMHSCTEEISDNNGLDFVKRVLSSENALVCHNEIENILDIFSEKDNVFCKEENIDIPSKIAFVTGGVCYCYLMEAFNVTGFFAPVLKISAYPLNENLATEFIQRYDEIIVIEELAPVIEEQLLKIAGKYHIKIKIYGKIKTSKEKLLEKTPYGKFPYTGAFSTEIIAKVLFERGLTHFKELAATLYPSTNLNLKEPFKKFLNTVSSSRLCAGCPYRGAFLSIRKTVENLGVKAIYSGDIGCYSIASKPPFSVTDTCLCKGAGISLCAGINRVNPSAVNFAFVGDSTFFHSGIQAIVSAVYNSADIIVAVLDNAAAASTGGQPHPGTGKKIRGEFVPDISIEKVITSILPNPKTNFARVNSFDISASKEKISEMIQNTSGVRVILFYGLCAGLTKNMPKTNMQIDHLKCNSCRLCIDETGCPAIYDDYDSENSQNSENIIKIDNDFCTGCGICKNICPVGAINKLL